MTSANDSQPYLSKGTKHAEAASLMIEPLAEYDPDGMLIAALAVRIPSVANGGILEDRTSVTPPGAALL